MGRGKNSAGRPRIEGGRGGRATGEIARYPDRTPASAVGEQRSAKVGPRAKIVLEDESSKARAASVFKEAAENSRKLRPHTADEIFEGCFGRSDAAMTRFLNREFRGRVSLLAGVGREGLNQVIQSVAVFWNVLEEVTPAQRAAALSALDIKPCAKTPLTQIFNNLLGLPDSAKVGEAAVMAARTRHSKYGRYVLGARLCGVPPDQISVEARKPRGLTRFGDAYRGAQRAERARRLSASEARGDKQTPTRSQVSAGLVSDAARKPESPGNHQQPNRWDEESYSSGSAASEKVLGPVKLVAEARLVRVELAASRVDSSHLNKGNGIAICLVDREGDVPELFAGVPVPELLRHDREAALAWVRDAINSAVEADRDDEAEADQEADDDR